MSASSDATGANHTSSAMVDETDKSIQTATEKDVKCDVCGECRANVVLLRCDACHCRVHLTCTIPRLQTKPRQRRWWCDACRQNPVSGSWSLTAAETSGDMDVKKHQREKQQLDKAERLKQEQWQQQQEREEAAKQTQTTTEQAVKTGPSTAAIVTSSSSSSSSSSSESVLPPHDAADDAAKQTQTTTEQAVKTELSTATIVTPSSSESVLPPHDASDDVKMSGADFAEELINRKRKPEEEPQAANEQNTDDANTPKRLRSSISGASEAAAAPVPATASSSAIKSETTSSTDSPSSLSRQLNTATPSKGPVPLARKAPIPLGSSPMTAQRITAFPPSPAAVPASTTLLTTLLPNNSNAQIALGVTDQKLEQQRLDALKAKIKEAKDHQLQKQMKSEPIVSKPQVAAASTSPSPTQPVINSTTTLASTAPPPSPSALAFPPLQTATRSPLQAKTSLTSSPSKLAAKSPRSLTAAANAATPAAASETSAADIRHSQLQGLLLKHLKTFPESVKLESRAFKKKLEPPEPTTEEMKESEKATKAKSGPTAAPSFVQTNALNELVLSIDSCMQKKHVGDKYVSSFRTLISNLRANDDITKQVLAGTISPAQLSSMQSSDFDDAEARARKHELAQEEMKMSIVQLPKQNNALSQYTESVIDQLGVLNATSLERSAVKSESDAQNESDAPPPLEGFDYVKHAINNPPSQLPIAHAAPEETPEAPTPIIVPALADVSQPSTPKGDSKASVSASKEKPRKPKELITVSDDSEDDVIMEDDFRSNSRASIAASNMEAAAKNLPALPDFHSFDAQVTNPDDVDDDDDDIEAPTATAIGQDDDDDVPTRDANRSPSPPNTSSVRESGRGSSVASSLRSDSPSSFASVDSPSRSYSKSQRDSDALWTGFMRWGKELIGLRAVELPQSSTQLLQVFKNSMPKVLDISMRAPFPTVLHSFKQAAAASKADSTRISSKGTLAIAKLESRDRSTSAVHPLQKIIEYHNSKERIALVKWKMNKAELGSCEGFLLLARPEGILSAAVLRQLFSAPIEVGSVYLCVHVSGAAATATKKPLTPTASSKMIAPNPTAITPSVVIPVIPPALQALSSITSQSSIPPTLQRTESQNSQYSAMNSPYPPASSPVQPAAVAYPYPPSPAAAAPPSAPAHLPYPMQPTEMQIGMDINRAPPTTHYPAAPSYPYNEPAPPSMSSDWDRGREREREREREPTWNRDRQYDQDSYRNPRDTRNYPPRDYNSHGAPLSDPRGRNARSRSRSRSPSRRYGAGGNGPSSAQRGVGRGFVHPDRGAMVPDRDRDRDATSDRGRDRGRYDNRGLAPQYGNNDGYRGRDDHDRRSYQNNREYGNTYSPPQRPKEFDREREWDRSRDGDRSYGRESDRQPYPSQHSQYSQDSYPQPPAQSHDAQSYPYRTSSSYDSAPSRDVPAGALPYPAQAPYQPYPAATSSQYQSNQYPQPPSPHSQYAHPPPPPPPPPPHDSRDAWMRK